MGTTRLVVVAEISLFLKPNIILKVQFDEDMTIAQIKETMIYYRKWRKELDGISYEIEEIELEED